MKHLLALLIAMPALVWGQTLQQTAGIYYAYPEPVGELTPAPDGYEPVYISHYGRHGSRWITDDYRYQHTMAPFDSLYALGQLTELGIDVRDRMRQVCDDALGRSGSLSPVGERQHRGIAQRMIECYPGVFEISKRVNAASSTSVRCVMSMCAFTERLKEKDPTLQISRTAYDSNMDYIAYTSPQGKEFTSKQSPWWAEHSAYVDEQIRPERLMASLVVNPELLTPEQQRQWMEALYWVASDMQDIDLDLDFYDIFTLEELQGIWRTINARMYACNGDAPLNGGVMKHCADNLLADIVARADSALAGGGLAADLRFGHDTHLLRLLARMGVTEASEREEDMALYHQVWRDYQLSPMAANLQLIFYSNADGDVLVKLLLNEHEAELPLPGGPYYKWTDVKALWTSD